MAAQACGHILATAKAEVFADGYVHADETPVKYQDPARRGSCGTGYLWFFFNPVDVSAALSLIANSSNYGGGEAS